VRVPLSWLAEWIDLPEAPEALAERLTLAGLTVDRIERIGPDLSGLRVGEVLACARHPDAERLSVCRVDVGEGEPVEIVCGAPNVAAGQKVAVVLPGQALPDGTKIKKTKLRGVVSNGMICSERELGLGAAAEGILVLDPAAKVGAPLASAVRAGDTVFEVEITPNRGDWVSILGVAREVRAHFGGELRPPPHAPPETGRPASESIRIAIADAEGCRRYVGRVVRGVRVGPSPAWLVARLEAAGQRSKSNVVDVTNLVLLELGQPLHAFDLGKLRGAEIRVRAAAAGEKLRTLDGEIRALAPSDLVIADAERAVALAGVIGGAETEVTASTRDVLVEAAEFDPPRVRRAARRLGLSTEASYRFERGVDPEGVRRAADRAALLLAEVCGGEVARGAVEALGREPRRTREIRLDPARVNRLLGTDIPTGEVVRCLERVEVPAEPLPDGALLCRVPSYRHDLGRAEDLVEEVARVFGYERIPTTIPTGALEPVAPRPERDFREAARDTLVALGLVETMGFPALDVADLDRLRLAAGDPRRRALAIQNPLAEQAGHLWTTLVPALLDVARRNRARQAERVRVFQIAHVFRARGAGELPEETTSLCALVTPAEVPALWDPRPPPPLFFEAKGIAGRLIDDLGVEASLRPSDGEPFLHPGAQSDFVVAGGRVGAVGELHPAVAAAFEIDVPCALLDLDLDALFRAPRQERRYREVSRQPRARRDLSLLFGRDVAAGDALELIRRTAGRDLSSLALFDRYEGRGIPEGKVSLAFRLAFQRPDRTLADEEVNRIVERVVEALRSRLGGELR
jgi:phenylalanyl-tRNA synthetase beta chain